MFDTFFQFFYEKNILGFPIKPNNKIRLTSFFYEEYVIGGFLFKLFFPIFIIIFLNINNKTIKYLFTLVFILYCSAIFITGERTSILLIFTYLFLTFLIIKKLRIKIFLTTCILFLSILLITFGNEPLKKRYIDQTFKKTIRINANNNFQEMFLNNHYAATFLAGYEIWKKNIIFGNGLRSYRKISCIDMKLKEKIIKNSDHGVYICNTHPHNIILEILGDIGLIGLILIILIFKNIIKSLLILQKEWFKNKIPLFFGIQLLTLFWPFIVHGSFFSSWNGTFFLISFAIFNASRKIKLY